MATINDLCEHGTGALTATEVYPDTPSVNQRRDTLSELRSQGFPVWSLVYGDLANDIPGASVREWPGWSALWPRPRASTWLGSDLAAAQESWDTSNAHVERHNDYVAKRAAQDAEKAEQQRIEAEKLAAATREQVLVEPKRAYLSAGGTEAEWDAIKDDVAAEIAKQQAIGAAVPHQMPPALAGPVEDYF